MIAHRHIDVNEENRSFQHEQETQRHDFSEDTVTRSYQERLDSRFFGYGEEFRREGNDYAALKNALRQILPQAAYRTWEVSISKQKNESLPYMGTARIASIVGVSTRKIQMDFQYMEQRGLLQRIPAIRNRYYVHLLDYHGLYQLAHEYIAFKDSHFGNIPADREFIALAPPELQELLLRVARYAAAMTHKKRGRKPQYTWTPEHATLKSPLGNAALSCEAFTDYYEDEVAQHPASHTPEHEADEHQAQVKTAPLPDSNQQSHSIYMAKENLQKNLQFNLQKISPYESESYDSNIVSVRDSNPLSFKNFFEDDSALQKKQQTTQSSILQFPSQNLPAKQTSRQATSISKQTMIRQGAEQTRIQQETRQALTRQSTGQATQRWPRLHHSIEYFLADISSEFGDQAPKSSISQVRRIFYSQLHPHGISMSQFYELIVFFKAEAQHAAISKTNQDGRINRMAWFLAAIRNHVHRAVQARSQGLGFVDALLTLVPARERKAAQDTQTQSREEEQHHAEDQHCSWQTKAEPDTPERDETEQIDTPGQVEHRSTNYADTDDQHTLTVPCVHTHSKHREQKQQLRRLTGGPVFKRGDMPCSRCHHSFYTILRGHYCCIACHVKKEYSQGRQQRIIEIINDLETLHEQDT